MAAIIRKSDEPYEVEFASVPVSEVSNREKKVPAEWVNEAGNDVTEELLSYLRPLIRGENAVRYENGIPKHLVLY